MASFTTNEGAESLQDNSIVWASDTIKARLVASSVTPNKDDVVMTGMTAIGTDQTLASKTRTKNTTDDRIVYDAADPAYGVIATGSTIGWCVVYKFVTNDADSIPIFVLDLADTPTNGSTIGVTFHVTDGCGYTQQ